MHLFSFSGSNCGCGYLRPSFCGTDSCNVACHDNQCFSLPPAKCGPCLSCCCILKRALGLRTLGLPLVVDSTTPLGPRLSIAMGVLAPSRPFVETFRFFGSGGHAVFFLDQHLRISISRTEIAPWSHQLHQISLHSLRYLPRGLSGLLEGLGRVTMISVSKFLGPALKPRLMLRQWHTRTGLSMSSIAGSSASSAYHSVSGCVVHVLSY
jgi:hypothetical protein